MLKGLPLGGPFHRALHPEDWSWTHTDELLALLAELVDYNNRLFIMANSKKGEKQPDPLELQRPGQPTKKEEPEVKRQPTHAEVVDFFSRRR